MKKRLSLAGCLLTVLALVFTACPTPVNNPDTPTPTASPSGSPSASPSPSATPGSIPVSGLSLTPSSATIPVTGTTTLTATVSPANASHKTVLWSSSNESVATVSDGLVTGISQGSATITAKTADQGYQKTATITVGPSASPSPSIPPSTVAVTGLSLTPNGATIPVTGTTVLAATVTPANATNKTVLWSSSNESVATVSGGLVTGISQGSATITATSEDQGYQKTATITVTPLSGGVAIVPSPTEAKLFVNSGSTVRLALGVGSALPLNAWTPWEIKSASTLFFPFIAEAGKTYTINWDDKFQGSVTGSVKNYTGDIMVTAVNAAKTLTVGGWSGNGYDSGYTSGMTLTVSATQLVYLAVWPYDFNASNCGSFALKINTADGVANQSYAWYENGASLPGALDHAYTLNPSSLSSGIHRYTVVATRGADSFSETYTYFKP